ncbi:MAG: peptidoglycan DD-metalloendopeptidase family protein [Dorea sp.]|nr:peptidoglycan DD-metalloendopeptidase family protein [Dorea sp.]
MNEKKKSSQKKRGATVAAVLCFVAAIAIAGTYTFNDYKKTQQKELARAEEENDTQEETTKEPTQEANNLAVKEEADTIQTDSTKENQGDTVADGTGTGNSSGSLAAAGSSQNLNFSENSQLLWPVDGTTIMSYSMDKTVYFSTLDQYKYNPALIISGAEGDQVISAAPGIVKSIDVTAETGTTVNVDLGNGYELFYGQLKEVPVKVGDYVEAKTIIGYVSQPTKYYSVEGCNLYFEMRKDGQPVNPVDYMAE